MYVTQTSYHGDGRGGVARLLMLETFTSTCSRCYRGWKSIWGRRSSSCLRSTEDIHKQSAEIFLDETKKNAMQKLRMSSKLYYQTECYWFWWLCCSKLVKEDVLLTKWNITLKKKFLHLFNTIFSELSTYHTCVISSWATYKRNISTCLWIHWVFWQNTALTERTDSMLQLCEHYHSSLVLRVCI